MARTHRVRGHMRNGHWVRPHYRKSRGRTARSESGGIGAGSGVGGMLAVAIIIGLILYTSGVLK